MVRRAAGLVLSLERTMKRRTLSDDGDRICESTLQEAKREHRTSFKLVLQESSSPVLRLGGQKDEDRPERQISNLKKGSGGP